MREIPDDYMDIADDDNTFGRLQQKPEPLMVYVYGDSTGNQRDSTASRTDWQHVREFFSRHTDRFRAHFKVPSSNGPVAA